MFKSRNRIISLIVFASASLTPAQDLGCKKIEEDQPSAYVAFEKDYEERIGNKIEKRTYLRLFNNTTCSIYVERNDTIEDLRDEKLYKWVEKRLENGLTERTYTQLPADAVKIVVFYDVRKSEKSEWTPANYYKYRDLVFIHQVFPGLSVVFSAEQKHSRKPYRISVPFTYGWENSSYENVNHRTFYWYELPTGHETDE